MGITEEHEGALSTSVSGLFWQDGNDLPAKLPFSTLVSAESEEEYGSASASMQASMAGTLKMLVARVGLHGAMQPTTLSALSCTALVVRVCYNSARTLLTDFRGDSGRPRLMCAQTLWHVL